MLESRTQELGPDTWPPMFQLSTMETASLQDSDHTHQSQADKTQGPPTLVNLPGLGLQGATAPKQTPLPASTFVT